MPPVTREPTNIKALRVAGVSDSGENAFASVRDDHIAALRPLRFNLNVSAVCGCDARRMHADLSLRITDIRVGRHLHHAPGLR